MTIRNIQIICNTITIPAAQFGPLHAALKELADPLFPPYPPDEWPVHLLDHFDFWGWSARIKNDTLCDITPEYGRVNCESMGRLFRVLAPYVQEPSPDPCTFAFYDPKTTEGFRYLFFPGEAGQPDTAQLVIQQMYWLAHTGRPPRRDLATVIANIVNEIDHAAFSPSSNPGQILAQCLKQADLLAQQYHEAIHQADHEEADLVDTQYREDESVYPLRQTAKLRALALELLIDHPILPEPM